MGPVKSRKTHKVEALSTRVQCFSWYNSLGPIIVGIGFGMFGWFWEMNLKLCRRVPESPTQPKLERFVPQPSAAFRLPKAPYPRQPKKPRRSANLR